MTGYAPTTDAIRCNKFELSIIAVLKAHHMKRLFSTYMETFVDVVMETYMEYVSTLDWRSTSMDS